MAVATLTAFPSSIIAGDTLRVDFSDGSYSAAHWALELAFRGPSYRNFTSADWRVSAAYEIVITASDTAKLLPGSYTVLFIYTHDDGERQTIPFGAVEVLPDSAKVAAKSQARQTLEAMQTALLNLSSGSNLSVSFNGQSFTKKNLRELQDAIDRQQVIVNREESAAALAIGRKRYGGIGIRFASAGGGYNGICD